MPIPKLQVEGLDQTVVSCVPNGPIHSTFPVKMVCHAPTTVGGCCPVVVLLCLCSANLVCMYVVCGGSFHSLQCEFINHSSFYFNIPYSILGLFFF
ncbi:uncharacterized protein BO88DRAFT_142496 [Aspergillus vadensis CBS 113365]|uniref:Uncharacterized protein n=1 Tax=Aspergillus vadensis (strain CBS 113365 / IMI 142717 / IBT 24658) TaxID=1448311 RepID=A0A319B0B3_ASPVC|nr:hypothetical protein BO88DRAFT_142496 [Aspergillus vadensis CBS 113365]PYH65525.1 hypothetical protein BO88DRAFT_142496 [Aspergillus vadensis CBS 113365]